MNSTTENSQNVRNLCYCSDNARSNFKVPAGYKIVFVEIDSSDESEGEIERINEFNFDFMDTLINYWLPRSIRNQSIYFHYL